MRTACIISVAIGAYLHYSLRAIVDWVWPAQSPGETLALEIRALRGELSSLHSGVEDRFPYGPVLVWSAILTASVFLVSRKSATELVIGRAVIHDDAPNAKVPRRFGAAPDQCPDDD